MLYFAFLRAVMPSGKNRVPMSELQQLLQENGYPGAKTYLHTGNILLKSDQTREQIAKDIHQLILTHIGPDLSVIVRTPEEIKEVLLHSPFKEPDYNQKRIFFSLLSGEPLSEGIQSIQDKIADTDEILVIIQRTAYMYIPGNATRSKLSNNLLEKKGKIVATSRNYNTLSRMLALAEEHK
ncbi:DUF1697 domain-containing protein [Candidatus Enterococcus willemsii]|uniref:DUF1697 domain-containing protein n=1 Tax=Candidatus Enterococcus willemsii TaxID=1857215 RepID=A0ABQ6YW13_9ENTE|nr:DUF1697 domain-containing protein [Enterococcus sp. CU12B]KAF1301532.1 hypothetical protein BAU17_06320 [Enterococcus sp. CU12B]